MRATGSLGARPLHWYTAAFPRRRRGFTAACELLLFRMWRLLLGCLRFGRKEKRGPVHGLRRYCAKGGRRIGRRARSRLVRRRRGRRGGGDHRGTPTARCRAGVRFPGASVMVAARRARPGRAPPVSRGSSITRVGEVERRGSVRRPRVGPALPGSGYPHRDADFAAYVRSRRIGVSRSGPGRRLSRISAFPYPLTASPRRECSWTAILLPLDRSSPHLGKVSAVVIRAG